MFSLSTADIGPHMEGLIAYRSLYDNGECKGDLSTRVIRDSGIIYYLEDTLFVHLHFDFGL